MGHNGGIRQPARAPIVPGDPDPALPIIKATGSAASYDLAKDTVELNVSGVLSGWPGPTR